MTKLTEKLLQAGAVLAICYFTYGFYQQSIGWYIARANESIAQIQTQLKACEAKTK